MGSKSVFVCVICGGKFDRLLIYFVERGIGVLKVRHVANAIDVKNRFVIHVLNPPFAN